MQLTHDVWYQVVKYFEHEADARGAPRKRAVLLNLAVTSRMLSSLALAVLWKRMISLRPIVDVINSFTPAQQEPLLSWVGKDNHGCWLLPKRWTGDRVVLRVKEYLGHIRRLHVWEEDAEECALWPILIASFWKDEPLLPNLQELDIRFTGGFATSYQYLTFMVPSKPKLISTSGTDCSAHMITFYQLLHSRGCSPTEVEYSGSMCLPPALTFFENLNSLTVSGPYKHTKCSSPYSLLELLQQLPSLSRLEIDLAALQIQNSKPLGPFEHPSLELLSLYATTEELHPFLSFDIIRPLAKVFSVDIWCTTSQSWKFLFNKLASIFPSLCDLVIEVFEIADTSQLVLSDLDKLLPQPMESLILRGVPNKLTQKDLHQMLEAWPELHTLTLTGGKVPFNAEALLSTFTYRNLHTLYLPLNFIPLASSVVRKFATRKNPLRDLRVAQPMRLPSALKGKVVLAQNFLMLLPGLELVRFDHQEFNAGVTDLRDILDGMGAVVAVHGS